MFCRTGTEIRHRVIEGNGASWTLEDGTFCCIDVYRSQISSCNRFRNRIAQPIVRRLLSSASHLLARNIGSFALPCHSNNDSRHVLRKHRTSLRDKALYMNAVRKVTGLHRSRRSSILIHSPCRHISSIAFSCRRNSSGPVLCAYMEDKGQRGIIAHMDGGISSAGDAVCRKSGHRSVEESQKLI